MKIVQKEIMDLDELCHQMFGGHIRFSLLDKDVKKLRGALVKIVLSVMVIMDQNEMIHDNSYKIRRYNYLSVMNLCVLLGVLCVTMNAGLTSQLASFFVHIIYVLSVSIFFEGSINKLRVQLIDNNNQKIKTIEVKLKQIEDITLKRDIIMKCFMNDNIYFSLLSFMVVIDNEEKLRQEIVNTILY